MTTAKIGLIGLGSIAAVLASNIADNGFDIAIRNRTTSVTRDFARDSGDLAPKITPTGSLEELDESISEPRAIILMVPAGQAVDDPIAALRSLMYRDDLIIDAGNGSFVSSFEITSFTS